MNQLQDSGQADAIEITPAMIEAGVGALADNCDASSIFQATMVFEAMLMVALEQGLVRSPALN